MVKYLIDSTILIDHLNGIAPATEWLNKLNTGDAVISAVTRAEVLVKAADRWEEVMRFLEEFSCLPISSEESDIAAGLRNLYKIKLPDAFQAALAKNEDIVLVTRDATDFKKIQNLEVKIPYRLP